MSALNAVAVRIQTHPSRHHLVLRLLPQLGAFEDVQVIRDPNPDGPLDSWRVHCACLRSMTPTASHLLVLQEDALPAQGFAQNFAAAVAAQPDQILALFAPGFAYIRRQMQEAQKAGLTLSPMRPGAFVPAVAISYPSAVVHAILDWADKRWNDRQKRNLRGADDGVIAMYCRLHRVIPLLLVPSIVDHDDTIDSIGKLHRRSGPHRRAALL